MTKRGKNPMSRRRWSQVSLWSVLTFAAAGVSGQAPAPERALARSAQDAQLTWGGCPPFMPAGCGLAVLYLAAVVTPKPGRRRAPARRRVPAAA